MRRIMSFLVRCMIFAGIVQVVVPVWAKTSVHSKERNAPIDMIVLHAIGGPYCNNGKVRYSPANGGAQRWYEYFNSHAVLGVHYIVDRSGRVISQITERKIANHALGWNQTSIGIELVNNGDHREEYPAEQIDALVKLVQGLRAKYPAISKKRVFRHSDLDKRINKCGASHFKVKQDPGERFEYQRFLEQL